MSDLAGAIRSGGDYKKTELKIGYGSHRGYFAGLGETTKEHSQFPCKRCKGSGGDCYACEGSGHKVTTKVPILYQLGPNLVQEEWVTYALTEPGKLQDGTPKSGSTLWSRMKAISGQSEPSAINAWFAALPKPIKIPVEIMVVDADSGNGCVIASVRPITAGRAPAAVKEADASETFDDEDFAGITDRF